MSCNTEFSVDVCNDHVPRTDQMIKKTKSNHVIFFVNVINCPIQLLYGVIRTSHSYLKYVIKTWKYIFHCEGTQ